MEVVRKGTDADFLKIKELWAECFGDDAFAEWYFARLYERDILRVCEVDGEICSMAFCFPKTLVVGAEEYSAWYLYGIGTKKSARGNGYAKRLISTCTAEAKQNGVDFCFLIPAEQSLFSFYHACGFDLVWTRAEKACITKPAADIELVPVREDFSKINEIYERVWSGFFKRDEKEWRSLLEEFRMADGELYQIKTQHSLVGYCFVVEEPDVLNIRELGIFPSFEKEEICHAVANKRNAKTWKLTHPACGAPFAAVLPFVEKLRTMDVFINCDLLHN